MIDFQLQLNTSIKKLRILSGLSQEKFCERCKLSVKNYRNLEYNKQMPKSDTVNKICSAFNLTPIELISYSVEKDTKTDELLSSIGELSSCQIEMVRDFILMLKKHEYPTQLKKISK